jgi:surface antigen
LFSYASNTSFWSHSALSFFSKDDWRLSKAARNDALNHYKDGRVLTWKNPQTGTHGAFAPYHTTYQHGELCRNLKILSTSHLVHEKAIYRFCRQQNEWKIM